MNVCAEGSVVSSGDEIKGRAKEAAGRLMGNRRLERQGKVDRASGKLKRGIDRIKDTLNGRNRRRRGTRR
jgi:uncharacterized protein YjbJ (UPF0337 family)